ncbi:MAG: NADP-dependent oxidoreductase, partial [Candidatus Dormibacteraceae bacterium]
MTGTYRAVSFSEYGGPDVLQLVELPIPLPGQGKVRIAVRAAGVNPIDWKIRSGAAKFISIEFPAVSGGDVAGVIDAVGPGVTEFAIGDEVLGSIGFGGYAELALAPVEALTTKPSSVPWEVAAALPIPANTVYYAFDELGLQAGETFVIDGAAGGVGTIAVQAAKSLGVDVIGTASQRNHDYLRSLGAMPVTYGEGLADRIRKVAPKGVDAALDASGRGSLPALVDVVGGSERVVTIADSSAADLGVRFISAAPKGAASRIATAAALAAENKLTVPIYQTYQLEKAADAQRTSEQGHV